MKNSILVVIDMQKTFLSSLDESDRKSVIEYCENLVSLAMKHDVPIIFVEWNDGSDYYEATTPELLDVSSGYKNRYTIYKRQQDGSDKVKLVVNHHKLNAEVIKVCGIFADQCVLSTVDGLIEKFKGSKILVYEQAVATSSSYSHEYGLSQMHNAGAIIV